VSRALTAAKGGPRDVLTKERLDAIWGVDAALDDSGALRVSWLDR
jgi:hypothetical protein